MAHNLREIKLHKDLDGLRERLNTSVLRPCRQRMAERLVRIAEELGSGEYGEVVLEVKSGCTIDGSWWSTHIYIRNVLVAELFKKHVEWHAYHVLMHLCIMRDLTKAYEAKRQDEATKEARELSAIRKASDAARKSLTGLVDSFANG